MKILLHCYPGYTYFFREAIRLSREEGMHVDWKIILYSNAENILNEFRTLIGDNNILYLQNNLNDYIKTANINLDELKDFPASIYECVSTTKVVRGHIHLQKRSREYQLKLIVGTYTIYKDFLLKNQPDYVLFPLLEGYDSVILYYLCEELDIKPIIYDHARNLGVSFFASSLYEDLPSYALKCDLSEDDMKHAKTFIHSFRNKFKPSFQIKYQPTPEEIIDTSYLKKNIFEKAIKFMKKRVIPLMRKNDLNEPHFVDGATFIHKLRVHFFPFTAKYRELKGELIHKLFYDFHRIDMLPQKFIYYPLQYSPETSINTPAPFFIDQLRAIDLILNSMPPNFYLVVKEHPAMKGIRAISFYKALRKKPGVLLADISLPSLEIIKRASLTISVTGTSCLEAFLLGRPSLHISRSFFTDWIYKFDSFSNFKKVIREAIESREVPIEKIIDLVGRIFNVGGDFVLFSPGVPCLDADLVMNKRNINAFLESLLMHIKRLKEGDSF